MKKLFSIFILITFFSCAKEELFSEESRSNYWLLHEGAELPIVVEGNTSSKVFVILLHGGPGSTAQEFNASGKPFTDLLEEDYAMVYYDQRNAGLARGEWDESKLTIEQHTEDLDKVIDLIKLIYGSDIKLFLAGHSWGGFLGTAYLLDTDRQAKVEAWINLSGGIHRFLRNGHNLERIISIADEQISKNENTEKWTELRDEVQEELNLNVNYDAISEGVPNRLKEKAKVLIRQDKLTPFNLSSVMPSIYRDNYDVFLILANQRKGTLIEQLYTFDETLEATLENITLPVLSIYGKYDVTTGLQQGEYLNSRISTLDEDKDFVILENSGHSIMLNEVVLLSELMKEWIEKYR